MKIHITPDDCLNAADCFQEYANTLEKVTAEIASDKISNIEKYMPHLFDGTTYPNITSTPTDMEIILNEQCRQLKIWAIVLREIGNAVSIPDHPINPPVFIG